MKLEGKTRNSRTINMDMISSLPDSLLCHILSFLPTTSAVATRTLSRRWRHLWKHLQVLHLVDDPFYICARLQEEPVNCFVAFVNEVLAQVRYINKFRLECWIRDRDAGALRSWINSVTGPHLHELHISLKNLFWCLRLPCGVFTCTSLVSLVLKGGASLADLPSVHLPSLKNLQLQIPNVDINKFLSGCPVLETLNVFFIWVNGPAIIHMPRSLKSLTFQYGYCPRRCIFERLQIDTPSLEYLHVRLDGRHLRILGSNFPNIVEAHLDIYPDDVNVGWLPELLRALCRTKLLVLEFSTTECLLRAPALDFPEFCCLLHLQLDFECFNSRFLIDLLHHCHKLQVLIIQKVPYSLGYAGSPEPSGWTQPTSVPNCVISQLNVLEFRRYQGSTEEHAFTAYILQRGLVLKMMIIHAAVGPDQKKKDHILKELSIMPRGSSICQLKLD